jgi:hypothetical protein
MRFAYFLCASAILVASCGGSSGPERPKPLRTRLDDMHIATVSMDKKEAVLLAQNEYAKAKMAYANAKSAVDDAHTKAKIAENEHKQARIDADTAAAKKESANSSGDMNRISAANREMKTADLKMQATRAKIKGWKAWRKAREYKAIAAEENMYYMQARFELSKANLARANNIRPKGFSHARFQKQEAERSRRAQKAKAVAEKETAKAKREWQKYEALKAKMKKSAGGTTTSK